MLKAALAGAGGSAPAKPSEQSAKIDASSFPCIDEGAPLEDIAASFETLGLTRQTSLAGSMPTRGYRNSVREGL